MTIQLKKIGAAVALTVGASLTAHALDLKIGVAGEPYPPFTTKGADGKWTGFEIDLVNSICQRVKANCTIVETAWDGIIPALTSKKIDVIFNSMSITPERQKTIAFSSPYYYTNAVMVGAKSLKLTGIKPADLKGKSIGVQTSTTHADYVKKTYGKDAKIKVYASQDDENADLAAGRIDVLVADETGIHDFLKSADGAKFEKKGIMPKDPMFGDGVGAGLRKSDTELKAKFDAAIKDIIAKGEFKPMAAKYLDYDITPR